MNAMGPLVWILEKIYMPVIRPVISELGWIAKVEFKGVIESSKGGLALHCC